MKHIPGIMFILVLIGLVIAPQPVTAQPSGPQRAGVEPRSGPAGTRFNFFAREFIVNEPVAIWLNTPDQQVRELYPQDLRNANVNGEATWSWIPEPNTLPGNWELVALGINSGVQHRIPFEITPTDEVTGLPLITDFASARFDLLLQAQVAGVPETVYGSGALILPDRVYARVTTASDNATVEVMRVGTDLYINRGGGWERLSGDFPLELLTSMPGNAQLQQLEARANGILYLGNETIRGVPTEHYQLWLTGSQFPGQGTLQLPAEAVIKIDLWIGVTDRLLHQQGSVITIPARVAGPVTLPEVQFQVLVTYYDFNSPGIVITVP